MGAANHIIRAEMATIIAENTYDKTGRLRSCYELAKFSGVTSSTALHYRDKSVEHLLEKNVRLSKEQMERIIKARKKAGVFNEENESDDVFKYASDAKGEDGYVHTTAIMKRINKEIDSKEYWMSTPAHLKSLRKNTRSFKRVRYSRSGNTFYIDGDDLEKVIEKFHKCKGSFTDKIRKFVYEESVEAEEFSLRSNREILHEKFMKEALSVLEEAYELLGKREPSVLSRVPMELWDSYKEMESMIDKASDIADKTKTHVDKGREKKAKKAFKDLGRLIYKIQDSDSFNYIGFKLNDAYTSLRISLTLLRIDIWGPVKQPIEHKKPVKTKKPRKAPTGKYATFGNYLDELITNHDGNGHGFKTELAEMCGIPRAYLSMYLSGKMKPKPEVLEVFSSVFNVPKETLEQKLQV